MKNLRNLGRHFRAAVDAKTFSSALTKVCMGLMKSVFPVLSEVYVRFFNGRCIITGTNLDLWVISDLPACGDDFAFVFSRTKEAERAFRYFDGCMTLELAEDGVSENNSGFVTFSCGSKTGQFETCYAADYPAAPELPEKTSFSANAAALLGRITKVAYATKKPGQGIKEIASCVEFYGSQILAVDGQRAAWDFDSTLTFPQPFLVYAEYIRLLKLLGNVQADFSISRPYFHVTDGTTTIILRMVEGEPFDIQTIVPHRYVEEFSVSPKKVLSELKFLKDTAPRTRIPCVCLCGNELFMTVNGRKYSTVIDTNRQNTQVIGFELRHLTDAFKQFGSEPQVKVKISGSRTPVVIEAEGRSDCALMLPVRLKENAAA